jgi:hypothetical protein
VSLIEQTHAAVKRLDGLLSDPHPGLFTWTVMLMQAKRDLDECFGFEQGRKHERELKDGAQGDQVA